MTSTVVAVKRVRIMVAVELQAQGYDLVATGDGGRIVATAIMERFCRGADGELELFTSGSSTRAVAQVVTHAGICKVQRYALSTS